MRLEQANRRPALQSSKPGPIFVRRDQVAVRCTEWSVYGAHHHAITKLSRFLFDICYERLGYGQPETSELRLPVGNGNLRPVPNGRMHPAHNGTGKAPYPAKEGRLRLRLHVREIFRLPAPRIDPPEGPHPHAFDLIVRNLFSTAQNQTTRTSMVVQQPRNPHIVCKC